MVIKTKLTKEQFHHEAQKFGLLPDEIATLTFQIFPAGMTVVCYPASPAEEMCTRFFKQLVAAGMATGK